MHPGNGRCASCRACMHRGACHVTSPGSCTPREPASPSGTYVAFAAGCGITPVLSVIRTLLAEGAGRVILFYGNTGGARAMWLEELLALKDRCLERLSMH